MSSDSYLSSGEFATFIPSQAFDPMIDSKRRQGPPCFLLINPIYPYLQDKQPFRHKHTRVYKTFCNKYPCRICFIALLIVFAIPRGQCGSFVIAFFFFFSGASVFVGIRAEWRQFLYLNIIQLPLRTTSPLGPILK